VKKVITMAMVAMIAGIAAADLAINWDNANQPVYDVGGSGGVGPFIESAKIQLMWSATGAITTPGEYALLEPGEYALDTQVNGGYGLWAGFGGIYTSADVGGADINVGFFFTRVYEATGAGGEMFVDVALGDAADFVYSATDPLTTFTDNGLGGAPAWIDQNGTTVVIPEPATLGLMGIAGLGMFLARRKARR